MRIAVLILPDGDGALPTGADFRRAGFAVSAAVAPGAPLPSGPPGQCAAALGPAREDGRPGRKAVARKNDNGQSAGRRAGEHAGPESDPKAGRAGSLAAPVPDSDRGGEERVPRRGKGSYSTSA